MTGSGPHEDSGDVTATVTSEMLDDLVMRIASQWERLSGPPLPADFTYDRNGLRLGIAALEDELREVYDVWAEYKKNLCEPAAATRFRHELLDVAAVAMLMYRNVPAPGCGRPAVVKEGKR